MRKKLSSLYVVIIFIILSTVLGYTAREEFFPSVKATNLTATTATVTNLTATNGSIPTLASTNSVITNLTSTNGIIYELVASTYSKIKGVYYTSTSSSITSHSDPSQVGSMAWCAAQ